MQAGYTLSRAVATTSVFRLAGYAGHGSNKVFSRRWAGVLPQQARSRRLRLCRYTEPLQTPLSIYLFPISRGRMTRHLDVISGWLQSGNQRHTEASQNRCRGYGVRFQVRSRWFDCLRDRNVCINVKPGLDCPQGSRVSLSPRLKPHSHLLVTGRLEDLLIRVVT